jgi:hypothetical protein
VLSFGSGDRVSFSDSEDYSDSEPPTPPLDGKGKDVAVDGGRRCRKRRHRRRRQRQGFTGFMAATMRSHPPLNLVPDVCATATSCLPCVASSSRV